VYESHDSVGERQILLSNSALDRAIYHHIPVVLLPGKKPPALTNHEVLWDTQPPWTLEEENNILFLSKI
jgi:hypothetical protein